MGRFVLVGTTLCAMACLAEPVALPDDGWEAKRAALKNRSRPLILNSDGDEVVYWNTNLPVTVGNFTRQRLQTYRGSQVSTVTYCPWSSGFGLMTTTRAGEFFDMPRCCPDLQPACHNAAPLLKAMGLDCLDLTADYCHTNGMEVFVSIRINDTHDVSYFIPGTKPPRSYVFPKWKDAHPDCLFGSYSNRPPLCAWSAVDFENPVTRAYMKEFVRDFVENYDVDGIEYDFFRHGQLLKTVGWGAYATEAQLKLMTDFMLELRAITEAAGRRKGRPILVLVRTSDSLAYAKAQGIDVEAWLRRGVMDIWSVSDYFQLDYLRPNAELAHKYGVKFNSALAESRVPGTFGRLKKSNKRFEKAIMLPGRNTIASYAAEYAAAMAAGCDGISSFNLSCTDGINKRGLLDVDPRRTKDLDKVYFALVRGSGGYRPESWVKDGGRFYVRPRIDPATIFKIPAGKPYVFGMEFGDEDWERFDVVAKAALADGREVITELKINGRTITLGAFQGGVHAFPLRPGDLRKGYNEFSVTVDPKFGKELTFHDFAVYLNKPAVAPEKMRAIYEEVKTPYKHGMVLVPDEGEMLDNPTVFRQGDSWYMMFIRFDGKGYETHLAKSDDLRTWTRLGRIFSRGAEGQWDAAQADGWPALVDTRWDGPNTLNMFAGKYWMMYLGGAKNGYETDPLSTGVAWTDDPSAVREWARYAGNPVLQPSDSSARAFERATIYKHFTVEDPTRACGGRFVNFYNAADKVSHRETIGMAVSDDMLHWRRVGNVPVIENGDPKRHSISGDPMFRRIGDLWVMFYFGYQWRPGGAFDTFACSYDLKHWTKWDGEPLVKPSEDFDRIHAHKPWVMKHDGVVYHWYCAVGKKNGREVRGIALATSKAKTPANGSAASVVSVAGVPRFAVGGRPMAATAVMPSPAGKPGEAEKQLRSFGKAGVRMSSDVWTMRDKRYNPRQWWLGDGEYDFALFDAMARGLLAASPDGFIFPRIKIDPPEKWCAAHPEEMETGPEAEKRGPEAVKPSSMAWRRLYRRMLSDMIAHVERTDYADRVVGYHIGALRCGEWLELGSRWDRLKAVTPGLKAYLRDPLPPPEVTAARRAQIDEATSAVADACIDAASCVKQLTGGRKLVGAFFGYLWLSHEKMMRVIESGQVDFFAAPPHYGETREPGRSGCSQTYYQASYRLHGRVYYEESDFRTCLSNPAFAPSGMVRMHPVGEAVGMVRRSIGMCLAGGWENWWFLLGGNDSFSAPELMESIRIGAQEERDTLFTARWTPAEVAVFTSADEYATSQGAHTSELWRQCKTRLHKDVLPFVGVPFDSYELSDIAHPQLPDYRVYVFPNAFTLSEEMRAKIKERVRRAGKTAIWVYAPGYYRNGSGGKGNVEDLTGIALERRPLGESEALSWKLEPTGGATVERDGARSVFFPLSPDAAALREAFRGAGAHVWTEAGDVLSAGRGYVMLHAASDGEKRIRLPAASDVREIFGASSPRRGVREIVENMMLGETRVYRLD